MTETLNARILTDLRNRTEAIRKEADAYAGRAELPETPEVFLAETKEMDQTADKALALQQEVIAFRNQSPLQSVREELDELHNRLYVVSHIIRPRLNRLRDHAAKMTADMQHQVNAVNQFVAEQKARLAELKKREADLLTGGYNDAIAKEMKDILAEKQIIKNELERWEN